MITKAEMIAKVKSGEVSQQEVIENGWLLSATKRIDRVKQPRGGYLRPRDFEATMLSGGGIDRLHPNENVGPALVGSAVDYLTRVMTGDDLYEAFSVSRAGARKVDKMPLFGELISQVNDLDDNKSIRAAVKLTGFDAAFRAGVRAYRPVEEIEPDEETIENVREMVERSLRFFDEYGPKVLDGLTFEGGYTGCVAYGDGDFLTEDTLWDFKVSKGKLQTKHTLQLLMYWRMGLHSNYSESYENIEYLGVYNPRQNIVYRFPINEISPETIEEVETEVIGY